MKAYTEQYFPVVEFIQGNHLHERLTEQYFLVMHFITCILYKVAITFKSVDENPKTNKHMNANKQLVHSCDITLLHKRWF